jgi:antitoxin ParD1/3/4
MGKRSTTRLNVALSEPLRQFVDAKVASGGYLTAAEYVCSLIQEAQEREQEQERLEALLLEGLDSGPGIEVTPEFWTDLRAELHERYGSPK